MSGILKPFGNLLTPGLLEVPSGALTIDPEHPLSNGMIGCWVPGAMGGVDLTGNLPTLGSTFGGTAAGVSLDGPSIEGAGLNSKFVSGTAGFAVSLGNTAYPQYTAFSAISLWWRGCIYIAPDIFPGMIGVEYSLPNVSPFNIVQIGMDNAGHWQMIVNSSGSQVLLTGPTATTNVMHSVVGIYLPGTHMDFYIDTVEQGPTGTGGSLTNTATSWFALGGIGSGTVGRFTTTIAAVWNRILSAAEVAWLQNYPYDFLIPAEYDMGIVYVPGASLVFSQQTITIPLLMTVPITVTAHG